MNAMKRTQLSNRGEPKELVRYRDLEDEDRAVFAVLSLLGPIEQGTFAAYVAELGIQNPKTDNVYKPSPVRELCKVFRSQGLARLPGNQLEAVPAIAHVAMGEHAQDKAFVDLLRLLDRPKERGTYGVFHTAQVSAAVAEARARARIGLYRGHGEQALTALDALVRNRSWLYSQALAEDPMLGVVPLDAPAEAYALLPGSIRDQRFLMALRHAFERAARPHWTLLEAAWQQAQLKPWVVMVECLCAEPSPAHVNELTRYDDPLSTQARMFAALRAGEHDRARTLAMQALDAASKVAKRGRVDLDGPLSQTTLFLLATGDATRVQAARSFVHGLAKKRRRDFELILVLLNEDATASHHETDIWTQVLNWVLRSARGQPPYRVADRIGDAEALMRERGCAWLATELAQLRRHFARANNTDEQAPRVGLMALCVVKAPWELALDALESMPVQDDVAPETTAAAARKERVVFEVRLASEYFAAQRAAYAKQRQQAQSARAFAGARELQMTANADELDDDEPDDDEWDDWHGSTEVIAYPDLDGAGGAREADQLLVETRVQARRGNGWTRGRVPASRAMLSASDSLPAADIDDQRVLAALASDLRYEHSASEGRVAVALIGHPRVFWGDETGARPTQVVRGQPEIVVSEGKHGLSARLWPPVDQAGVGVHRDAGNRLVVVELDAAANAVAAKLQGMPAVPVAGRARLEQLLQRLASRFAVRSSVELATLHASTQVVEPDCRPLVELRRAEPGMHARVCVQPLEGGPQLVPGAGERVVLIRNAEESMRCERRLDEERVCFDGLCEAAPVLQSATQSPVAISTLDACLALSKALNDLGDRVRVTWPEGEPLVIAAHADLSTLRLKLVEQGEWLSVTGTLQLDDARVEDVLSVLQARTASGQFALLPDGQYVSLAPEVIAAFDALTAAGSEQGTGKKRRLSLPPVALGFLGSWLRDVSHTKLNEHAQRRLQRIEKAYASQPVVPRTFDAELRPYQQVGYEWLWRLTELGGGACLADDMGLGKTLMTLALLLSRAERGPALVVCPTSVRANWMAEAARFSPTLQLRSFESGRASDVASAGPFDVIVCSYTLMAQRIDVLETVQWTTVVLDEAQSIKNISAQRTHAAHRLLSDARVALTGTPVENHLGDLYSIMSFLNPGLLGSAEAFQRRFGKPIQNDGDPKARQQLRTLIAPFVLRRRKNEVLRELPERTEVTLRIEPTAEEQAFSEALRRDALVRAKAAREGGLSPVMLLAEITKLRRAACCPLLVDPGATVGTAKLDAAMELVAGLRDGKHRALVFSQFVGFLELVRARCEQAGIAYQYLDGSTPEKKRQNAVTSFQAGEGDVFLISLKAGGFGLNLTAADYVIHLDPWWNPAVEAQASDRAHRIGQTRPVTVYRLVNAASIEEIVLRLHERKREVANDILDGTDRTTKLDTAMLLSILEDRIR